MTKREAPEARPAGFPENVVNNGALLLEQLARDWANKPTRTRAPLQPNRREVALGLGGTAALGAMALFAPGVWRWATAKPTPQLPPRRPAPYPTEAPRFALKPDYEGTKVAEVSTTPIPKDSDYGGTKPPEEQGYTQFYPEGATAATKDNISLRDLSEKGRYSINMVILDTMLNNPHMETGVPSNTIVDIVITDQEFQNREEEIAFENQERNRPGFVSMADEYFAKRNIPKDEQKIVTIILSLPGEMKKAFPSGLNVTAPQAFYDRMSSMLTFKVLSRAVQELPHGRYTAEEVYQRAETFVNDRPPIKLVAIDTEFLTNVLNPK